MLSYLIAAHLVGDFILQNHWMQRKRHSSLVCTVHVLCYALPFVLLQLAGPPWSLPLWALTVILGQHWLQDRFGLHQRWMQWYGQTPPESWPIGPLCLDQAWHVATLAIVSFLVATL